jgi:hypothetical protein
VIESIEAKHCSTKRRRRSSIKRSNNANDYKKKNKKKKKKKRTSTRAAKAYVDDACEEASSDGSSSNVFEDFMPSQNKDDYSIGSRDSNEGDLIQYPGEEYNDDDDSFIVASDIEDDELSSDDSHVDFGGNQGRDVNDYLYHDGANNRFDLEGILNNIQERKKQVIDESSSSEGEGEEEEIEDDQKPAAETVTDPEEEKDRILNERARASLKIPNPLFCILSQMSNANTATAAPPAAAAATAATAATAAQQQQQQSYALRPQQYTVPYLTSCNASGDVDIDEVLRPYATYFSNRQGKKWELRVREIYKHMKSTGSSYVASTPDDPCLGEWARDQRKNDNLPVWKMSILNQIGFAWSR